MAFQNIEPSVPLATPGAGGKDYSWLLAQMDRMRHYLRLVVCIESLVYATVALLIVAPSLFLLDNLLHFSTPLRLAGALSVLVFCATAFLTTLRLALQRWSHERLAMKIEERFPELDNRLINAVQLGAMQPDSPSFPLIASLVEEAACEASARQLRQAVNTRGLKRGAIIGAALGLFVILYAFLLPDYFQNAARVSRERKE